MSDSSQRTVACQAPLSMGFSQQEYYSVLPCHPTGELPNSGIKPASLTSRKLAGGFLTLAPAGKPRAYIYIYLSIYIHIERYIRIHISTSTQTSTHKYLSFVYFYINRIILCLYLEKIHIKLYKSTSFFLLGLYYSI